MPPGDQSTQEGMAHLALGRVVPPGRPVRPPDGVLLGIGASGTSSVGRVEKADPRRASAPRSAGLGNVPGRAQAGPIVHQRRYGAVALRRRLGGPDDRFIRPFLASAVGPFGRAAPRAARCSMQLQQTFGPLPGHQPMYGRNFTGRRAPTDRPVAPPFLEFRASPDCGAGSGARVKRPPKSFISSAASPRKSWMRPDFSNSSAATGSLGGSQPGPQPQGGLCTEPVPSGGGQLRTSLAGGMPPNQPSQPYHHPQVPKAIPPPQWRP